MTTEREKRIDFLGESVDLVEHLNTARVLDSTKDQMYTIIMDHLKSIAARVE